MAAVLLFSSNRALRRLVRVVLRSAGHTEVLSVEPTNAQEALARQPVSMVVIDLDLSSVEVSGILGDVANVSPRPPVLALAPHVAFDVVLPTGADAVLSLPFEPSKLLDIVARLSGAATEE
jgi:DNA-binding NtrC family response regulator